MITLSLLDIAKNLRTWHFGTFDISGNAFSITWTLWQSMQDVSSPTPIEPHTKFKVKIIRSNPFKQQPLIVFYPVLYDLRRKQNWCGYCGTINYSKSAFIICMNRTNILKRSNLLWWILCWIFTKSRPCDSYCNCITTSSLLHLYGVITLLILFFHRILAFNPKTHLNGIQKQNELKCLSTYFFERFIFCILSLSRKPALDFFFLI